MKNFRYILSSIVLLAVVFTACDTVDFGDTNVDDDSVTEANTEGLMAGAMNRYATLAGGAYLSTPTLYAQYQSQAVYTSAQRYGASPSSWDGYYVQTLSNLNEIIEITTADEVDEITRSYGAPVNQANVAELMSVLIWKRVTDTWGPVPYTNALGKGETLTPEYTDQETIYKDLISRAKSARDALNASLDGPTGDAFYGGDVNKWKRFANSFILNLSMQLSKKYPGASGYAATEFSSALSNGAGLIENIDQEMWYDYANQSGMENPFSLYRGADYFFSEPLDRAMRGISDGSVIDYSNDQYDDRLNVFSSDTSLPGRPYGYESLSGGSYSSMSERVRGTAGTLPYFTAAKTYLLRAEAAELGWTSENSSNMLQNGIEMSYATVEAHWDDGDSSTGMLQSDGTQYALDRIADAATSGASMRQVINEEIWIAVYPMGYQAWSNWRRTDYPGLQPAPDAINNGEIPRRFIYPGNESGVNSQSYNSALDMLSPSEDGINSRFWWDQQ